MACNTILWCVWPSLIVLWIWMWEAGCDIQYQAEEVEIFHSDKQTRLGWYSEPLVEWSEIKLNVDTPSKRPVLQACARSITRTILSQWMERKDAHQLLMDISFAEEEETSGQLRSLQVHLLDSDTPMTRFQNGRPAQDLRTSNPFHTAVLHSQISSYLDRRLALSLGSVSHRGFQLAFSYSGRCVLITSIRLYYRRCPDTEAQLVSFKGTGAMSGRQMGSCVKGAVEVFPPVRECNVDGVWGPMQGGCTCEPGHQVMDDTCQACRMDYYKPANESGECRRCPPNSRTHGEGSERCDCLQGFSRLPTDLDDLGCTKPPSPPLNPTSRHHNDSVQIMTWDPPHDWGGRKEIKYCIKCEKEASSGHQWEACGDDVVFLPDSTWLTNTSIIITELNPQRNYRLSVQAWNDISTLQQALHTSTATIFLQRCSCGDH
ncbi:ephrin type-A receptor 3 isoform X2 [Cottoperca gobio]|uniref:Ephrin type-A receptor 3 isoform X2 n=1 Tax=Cottoperca gobio TaxID=56716 RepID=A0A6J2RNM3_COTGO|nr:ephrin type-A receptor 3-like isoform X2 [Cottoperca gobio]